MDYDLLSIDMLCWNSVKGNDETIVFIMIKPETENDKPNRNWAWNWHWRKISDNDRIFDWHIDVVSTLIFGSIFAQNPKNRCV